MFTYRENNKHACRHGPWTSSMERTSASWLVDTLNIMKGMIRILPSSQPNLRWHLQMKLKSAPINIEVEVFKIFICALLRNFTPESLTLLHKDFI
jgi:hypothetical protein